MCVSGEGEGGAHDIKRLILSFLESNGHFCVFVKVYWNAKLVFAGGKFNGYGVALKDFAREVCVCVCVGVCACLHVYVCL